CTFTGNTAGIGGGGVYNEGNVENMSDCVFTNNKADYGGGVINYSNVTSTNGCTFAGNTAGIGGGGVYNDGNVENMSDCAFTNNTADYGGGGIYNTGTFTSFHGNNFTSNFAVLESGGAINSQLATTTFRLKSSFFMKNSAAINGGAIAGPANSYTEGRGPDAFVSTPAVDVEGCTFENNVCSAYGGAVSGKDVRITSSDFTNNNASTGGAVYSQSQFGGNGSNHFTRNSAHDAGGAIFIDTIANWTWPSNGSFANNSAGCCYDASYN
ncbi:unnamed protein product, partial [Phaeothamnion confervicola]